MTTSRNPTPAVGPISHADSELVITAEEAMRDAMHPSIFNHTMRTLHLAWHLPAQPPAPEQEAVAMAVLFHDAGTIDANNGEQRFEVEGADLAADFLTNHGYGAGETDAVWEAIALHTSPGIAERRGVLACLTRRGVGADFGIGVDCVTDDQAEAILRCYPRLDMAAVLVGDIVRHAARSPHAAARYTLAGELARERVDPGARTTLERAAATSRWGS